MAEMTEQEAIDRLARNGMVITPHNITCMQFYTGLEKSGADAFLLSTVCFEGSPAQKAAQEADAEMNECVITEDIMRNAQGSTK